MESKDNRSKEKRNKMKQFHQRKNPTRVPLAAAGHNTSSSSQVEIVRGVIDVADSSDDYAMRRKQNKRFAVPDSAEFDNVENAQMHAGDFNLMAQLPTAIGGHFQFASEKQWDTPEGELLLDSTEASEYFTLNLKLLNVGLQTIPFFKRMDYSSSMFTPEQLVSMEKNAEIAENAYQSVLREHEQNPHIKINSASRKTLSARSQRSTQAPAGSVTGEAAPDELDELLNMTTAGVANIGLNATLSATSDVKPTTPQSVGSNAANKEEIQQWLDNVLEE